MGRTAQGGEWMGTFSDFLGSHGITREELLRVSARIESTNRGDRAIVRAREAKRGKEGSKSYDELGLAKPRSGRPLRPGHVDAAMGDLPVPAPVRSKFVRAVNRILEKKGAAKVDAPALFGKVPSRQGKKPRA